MTGEDPSYCESEDLEHSAHFYVYVDNLGVMDFDYEFVSQAMQQLQQQFDSLGLELHASEVSAGAVDALGCTLDGAKMQSRLQSKRLWKVHQGLAGLLRRGRCSGQALEKVLGHCTFCGLMNRRSLSCFCSVYAFIHAHYGSVAPLWPSVKDELSAFQGLLFLLVQDWWKQWNPLVTSSDASLSGYGCCKAWWPREAVSKTGRIQERSRFRRSAGHSARESALTVAGFEYDGLKWGRINEASAQKLAETGWELDDGFVEVPSFGLRREFWSPTIWGRWHFSEAIGVLEARAILLSFKRLALTRYGHDMRHLHLSDNLGIVLSVERSRARNFKVLKILREIAAYCFARNIQLAIRWVPSELNIADEPSRVHDVDESKLLVDLLSDVCDDPLFSQAKPRTPEHTAVARHGTEEGPSTDQRGPKQLGQTHTSAAATTDKEETASSGGKCAQLCKPAEGPDTSVGQRGHGAMRFKQPVVKGLTLPLTETSLALLPHMKVKKDSPSADGMSGTSSTSSELRDDAKGERKRTLQRRTKKRLRLAVNHQMEDSRTFLEIAAVTKRVRENYAKRLAEVENFFTVQKIDFSVDSQVDACLLKFFEMKFKEGEGIHYGDTALAALMDRYPEFGKCGHRKIPRSWRWLKGWRKLALSRSRLAYPLPWIAPSHGGW